MVISYEKWIEKVFKSHTHKSHLPPKGTGSRTFSGTNILQPCNKLLSCLCNTLVRRPAFTTSVLVSNVKLTLIVGHYHALKRRARQKKRKRKKEEENSNGQPHCLRSMLFWSNECGLPFGVKCCNNIFTLPTLSFFNQLNYIIFFGVHMYVIWVIMILSVDCYSNA